MSTTTAVRPFPWSEATSVEEERVHRKQRLAAAFRIFARHDLDEGVAGHLSVRDPEWPDHFWVNPFGVPFSRLRTSHLVLVDDSGAVVDGDQPINQSAFAIHASIHRARPDVDAAAHSHSRFGRAWSALGRPLDPISQDHCDFYRDHGVYTEYHGRVLDRAEGDAIADSLGTGKAVILRNHGLLSVGQSVEEATWWFLRMERCCEAQLLAEAAGTPLLIDDDAARHARDEQGTPLAGWFTAQSIFADIIEAQPDLLG